DGSWYFSLFYSVAEDLRRDAGRAAPGFDGERLAVGADEPKEAVEEMFKSLIELDFIVALNRLDPVEFEALYDYRELLDPTIEELMDDAGQTADEAGATWELTRLITSSNEIRGRTTVGVELIEATITAEGAFMNLSMQDGCLVVERRDETGTETTNTCELSEELAAELPPDTPDWLLNDRTQFNIRVVERNGRWYVSGWPSMIGNLADQLAELSPAEWQDRKDFYADLIDGLAVDGLPNLESQGF
ncbi:MAG: hypothetical protein OER95_05600, partial [Acidimicrobiia bacterium]|nr:hypothetical protein [Acidimicrobiia bacterium]